MIKINNTNRNIEEIAKKHYEALKENLALKLQYLGSACITKDKLNGNTANPLKIEYEKLNAPIQTNIQELSLFLLENEYEKLKEIILCKPDEMSDLHKSLEDKYSLSKFSNMLKKIFNYDSFCSKNNDYNAYKLCDSLNIPVCPYCNRIYISMLKNGKLKKDDGKSRELRPPLDHFYPRSKYPIFGLSFYNLIPSCTFCNSSLKGDKEFTAEKYIHPYREGFEGNAKFSFKPTVSVKRCMGTSLKITPTDPKNVVKIKKRIENSDKVFEIEVLYQQNHQDIAEEIYDKNLANSPEYRESLFSIIKDLSPSREEFYRFYFANYMDEKDHEKRPLAKFTRDLVDDLGIMDLVNCK